jgi:pimeloyl-ACP methyl ester carboxylesterase
MATFVLVHGGWHGGWAWREVARRLRAAGHEVYAPTLTGLGERVHLLSERVSQELHAEDVANVLFYEDLRDVVLVGHSYSGIVITLAAERTDRIGQLVYLDAMVPRDGGTFLDLLPEEIRQHVTAPAPGALHTHPPMQVMLEMVPAWVAERLVPQPAMDIDRPILLPARAAEQLPRTYLAATVGEPGFEHWREAWISDVRSPPWRYREYHGDHEVMLKDPELTASLLLAVL